MSETPAKGDLFSLYDVTNASKPILLTGQVVPIPTRGFIYLMPQDVLHLIFAAFVFALAYIFQAAAEMADDHAQIV